VKLSKTLVVPLAGLLVVVAAGAVLATSGAAPVADPGIVIAAAATASPVPAAGTKPVKPPKDTALTEVLDDLVTKGTITAAQKTAILNALAVERTARQAERQAARAERKAIREKVKGFLSDGAITQAELDQLPADHPLRKLTTLMDDGKITLDELKSLGRGGMKDVGLRGGGHGWKNGQDKPKPAASPTTSG
jgi:polyhydroxyalkanoate synthesis regulator phasin